MHGNSDSRPLEIPIPQPRNTQPCVDQGADGRPCSGPPTESRRCTRHARTWRRNALRCDAPGCNAIISDPHSPLGQGFVRGRTLPGLWSNVTYCRRCEPGLFRLTPGAEAENTERVFSQLVPAPFGPGWHWIGKTNSHGYGLVVPAGGTSRHEFLVHRVVHGLLSPTGGHRLTEVLDHRDHDRANAAIFNLEPVSVAENRRRRDRPPRGPLQRLWSRRAAELAEIYQLPVPENFPTITDWPDAEVIVPLTKKPADPASLAA